MQKILVIDDDDLVLRTFAILLKREGYHVFTADCFNAAMSTIEKEKLDLIVSDIRMPGKNGVDTIKAIQAKMKGTTQKELPVIFITGYAEMSIELDADFLGEVLYKPIDNHKLLSTIRDYL